MDIGTKIKAARTHKGMTLRELSEISGLSVGVLSQLERGLTSIAVDSLENLAKVLEIPLAQFFDLMHTADRSVVRSYERSIFNLQEGGYISYNLSPGLDGKVLLPRVTEVLPSRCDEEIMLYHHEGEEFIYVLEGILTLVIGGSVYDLYPGDSAHFCSETDHNWKNRTAKTVRILTVNYPNFFGGDPHGK